MSGEERGLEFLVGEYRLVVLSSLVDRVVEVELSPRPPLARAWIGGFGVHQGAVFATIDLDPRSGAHEAVGTEPAACVLLDTGKATFVRWALRVRRTGAFVNVTRCSRPATLPPEWPAWVVGGKLTDQTVGLLDVPAMTRDFSRER